LKENITVNGYGPEQEEKMNTRLGMLMGLVALGLLCAIGTAAADNATSMPDTQVTGFDIPPYHGPFGPDSSLYGMKLAFENLDSTFTFNQSERLEKEINYTDLRLSELESALASNRTDAADRAISQYWQNLNQTERTFDRFNWTGYNVTGDGGPGLAPVFPGDRAVAGSPGTIWSGSSYTGTGSGSPAISSRPRPDDTVLLHAQELIARHQLVLENLQHDHPDYQKIATVFDYNQRLEQRFEEKTQVRFDRIQDTHNRTLLQAEHLNFRPQGQISDRNIPSPAGGWPVVSKIDQGKGGQSWQDQNHDQRHLVLVPGGHDQFPTNFQEGRNGNGSGGSIAYGNTTRNDSGNNYRNLNRDPRARNS